MNFDSAAFALFALTAIVTLNLIRDPGVRIWLILAFNAAFIASFALGWQSMLPLLGFLAIGYAGILAAERTGWRGLLALVAAVIALFVWLKKYTIAGFLPGIGFPYLLIGLSYILFRVLHLMIDVNQKAVERPGPVAYLTYATFFLSFVSGPIQRFEDFAGQMAKPAFPASFAEINGAFGRILRGLVLILVTGFTIFLFNRFTLHLQETLTAGRYGTFAVIQFVLAALVFLVHLYLNFVAYMEIVIGVGILCGIRLPENFNKPYLAKNFLDLWARWHITLSEWFKFYLFNPVLKALSQRWPSGKLLPYLGAIAFFVTFLVMGIWHGSTLIFVLYGAMLGLGAAGNKLYQVEMSARLGRKRYKALSEKAWYRHASRGLALGFFALGIVCVWITPDLVTLVARGGIGFVLKALAILVAVSAGLSWLGEVVGRVKRPHWGWRGAGWMQPVATGAMLFAILAFIIVFDSSSPEFVYKAF
jgi:alginate O-acetyltransferase complex protein AlgI